MITTSLTRMFKDFCEIKISCEIDRDLVPILYLSWGNANSATPMPEILKPIRDGEDIPYKLVEEIAAKAVKQLAKFIVAHKE